MSNVIVPKHGPALFIGPPALLAPMPSRVRRGGGYLGGEFPGGITTVDGAPVAATVRVLLRTSSGHPGDGALVGQAKSAPDGAWRVSGLPVDLKYDVVGRKDGFNDVIMANVSPVPTDIILATGALVSNDAFDGLAGFVSLYGGYPPYTITAHDSTIPAGLSFYIEQYKLISDGVSVVVGVLDFTLKIASASGASVLVDVHAEFGLKEPTNLTAVYVD